MAASKKKDARDAAASAAANICVMEVVCFPNNTFATTGGLGESVLRGKFHIIGNDRDQLWMQVWRFGFGRSVSGSTYSEGRGLSHEDAKVYWGSISVANGTKTFNGKNDDNPIQDQPQQLLEAKGSVMYGWGLEPQPIARFILREATEAELKEDEELLEDEEEDEEQDENDDDTAIDIEGTWDGSGNNSTDGVDWSSSSSDAFQ